MKKYLIVFIGLIYGVSVYAQGEVDALKYSQNQLSGTAHYMGMAGALNSLGGDISAISQNPAGIAVYQSSELATTLGLNFIRANTDQLGNRVTNDLTTGSFNNIGYIGTSMIQKSGTGIMNYNFGFVYNRLKSFDRNYRSIGSPTETHFSLTDYIAYKTSAIEVYPEDMEFAGKYDPYGSNIPWLSTLAYQGWLINPSNDDPTMYESRFGLDPITKTDLDISERGHVDTYDFSFGFNASNLLYAGFTLGITDLSYSYNSSFSEFFANGDYELRNSLITKGAGVNVKLGVILRPTYFWRIGLAYHSPTFYNLTDYYYGDVYNYSRKFDDAGTPDGTTEYQLQTPQRLLLGTSFVIGKKGVVSFDYEFCDYSTISLRDDVGSSALYSFDNKMIKEGMLGSHTVKVGGEYRITSNISARAGYALMTSPVISNIRNGNTEVFTVGTIPHYTVEKKNNYITCGLGYRIGNIFLNAAYILNQKQEDVYAFSPVFDNRGQKIIYPTISTLNTNRNNVLMTFGVRF